MTPEAAKIIQTLETRVRQMLMLIDDMRQENARLTEALRERDAQISSLNEEISACRQAHDTLKMARIMEIGDGDKEMVRNRINRLIREVDKCINIIKN